MGVHKGEEGEHPQVTGGDGSRTGCVEEGTEGDERRPCGRGASGSRPTRGEGSGGAQPGEASQAEAEERAKVLAQEGT